MRNPFQRFVAALTGAIAATTIAQSDTRAQPMPAMPDTHADLALVGAQIWTNDALAPQATALAARDGLILAIGDDQQIRRLIGPDTQVIDANGARVLPGLIDAHLHLENGGESLGRIALRDAQSKEALLSLVQNAAAKADDDDQWILGRGWSAESWDDATPPTADELDSAAGARPAILVRMDGHQLIASRRALELAGIDDNTPPPPGGKFGRLPDGRLSGQVYEEAMELIWRAVPDSAADPAKEIERHLKRAAQECVRNGVTQVGAFDSPKTAEALGRLDRAGELPIRVGVTVFVPDDTIADWRPVLEWALRNRNMSERVKVIGFKGYMDGALGSRTAWMMAPYEDNPPGENPDNAGMPLAMASDGTLRELILLGASMGLQPTIHAIGDRANHELLNWFAEIPEQSREALRPRVEHAQHVLPNDVARFAKLGVIPSMQPLHKADDGRYAQQRIGPERLRASYAFRDFTDQNAGLAFGSDWPVVSVNPFLGVHAAVSALAMDGSTFLPEQAITVEEALRAYLTGAARALHSETITGALRVGWAADFIILDRDILTVPVEQIPETAVLTTVVGGEVKYQAERASH